MSKLNTYRAGPDERGHFGIFGGLFGCTTGAAPGRGEPATCMDADFDDSGTVDIVDFAFFAGEFGSPSAPDAPTLTPEPTTLGILVLGGSALLRRRHRTKQELHRRRVRGHLSGQEARFDPSSSEFNLIRTVGRKES